MERGWWTLTIEGFKELTDIDKEHIANCIKNGFTCGELLREQEDEVYDDDEE